MLSVNRFKKIIGLTAFLFTAVFFVSFRAEAAGLTVGNASLNLAAGENIYYGVTSGSNANGNFLLFEKGAGNTVFKIDYNGNITTNGNVLGSNSYWNGSGANIFNSNTGNVGIGTSTATTKLFVNGDVTAKSFLGALNSGNISAGAFGSLTGGGNYSFPGNLGIGTTAPTQKLEVNGNILATGSSFDNQGQGVLIAKSVIPLSQWREVAQGANVTTTGGTLINGGPTAKNGRGYWSATATGQSITLSMPGSWWTRAISFTSAVMYESSDINRNLPDSFLVEKSTDGSTWTTVANVTGSTSWYFYSTNLSDAPYIRITVNGFRSGQTSAGIANIQVFDSSSFGTDGPFTFNGGGNAVFMGGNVGIGTTDPGAYRLNVNGNSNITGVLSATSFSGALSGTVSSANVSSGAFGSNTGGGNYTFPGNVGIGTTAPNAKLQVNGGDITKSTTSGYDGTFDNLIKYAYVGDIGVRVNRWNGIDSTITAGTASANKLKLKVYQGTTAQDQPPLDVMTLQGDGNVAIGTTTPGVYRLFVNGNTNINGVLTATSISGPMSGTLSSGNVSSGTFGSNTGGGNFSLLGNFGIGTTNPTAKLDVVGGNIDIDNTTFASQTGIITKNGARFIHDFNYGNNGTVTTTGANTFIGLQSGNFTMGSTATNASQSSYNTAVGYGTMFSNITGYSNSALGAYSLNSITTGAYNSAFGQTSLQNNTTGLSNSALGQGSFYSNVAGNNGTALGYESQRYVNNTSTPWTNYNTSVGYQALRGSTTAANNTGNANTAIGYISLLNNTTGSNNTALGQGVLQSNTTGNNNSAVGLSSLINNTTGSNNSAFGFYSGFYIADGSTANQTSNNSVYLGYNTKALANGDNNETVIGYNAVGIGSNSVVLGNDSVVTTALKGNVGIGTTNPGSYKLFVNGAANFTGTVTAGSFSGPMSGTLSSGNVSAGAFGSNTGGGNYSFPGNVGIGTTAPKNQFQITPASGGTSIPVLGTIDSGTGFYLTGKLNPAYGLMLGVLNSGDGWIQQGRTDSTATAYNLLIQPLGGNVGIGTTAPSEKLETTGNIKIGGQVYSSKCNVDPSSGVGWYRISIPGGLLTGTIYVSALMDNKWERLEFNYSARSYISSNASVGSINVLRSINYNNGPISMIRVGADSTSGNYNAYLDIYVNSATTPASFIVYGNNGAQLLSDAVYNPSTPTYYQTVDLNQIGMNGVSLSNNLQVGNNLLVNNNVGIGSTNPSTAKLVITPSGSYSIDAGGGRVGNITSVADTDAASVAYVKGVIGGGSGSTVGYWTQSGSNIYNSNGGNVGIGTTTPGSYKLFVNGNTNINGTLSANSFSGPLAGTVNSTNVSAGAFAANTGGGNFSFPGNVGIGTTNPGAKLDVAGSIQGGTLFIKNNSDTILASWSDSGDAYASIEAHNISNSAKRPIVINAWGGNVGIGTTSPSQKLDVNGNANFSGTVTAGSFSGPMSGTLSSGNVSAGTFGSNTGGGNYSFTGNVGIGTTAPAAKLDVEGGNLYVGANASSNGTRYSMNVYSYDASLLQYGSLAADYTDSMRTVHLLGNANTQQIKIDSSAGNGNIILFPGTGNVGIGTTAPGAKLQVSGGNILLDNNYGLHIKDKDGNPYYALARLSSSGTTIVNGNYGNTSGTLQLRAGSSIQLGSGTTNTGTDFTPYMTMLGANGNVGIGTTSPVAKLDVVGNANFSGTVTAGSFSGPLSGTINSANVSAGDFGANTGHGTYSFSRSSYATSSNPSGENIFLQGAPYDAAQSVTWSNSPGIGFHWPGRTWGSLVFDGTFNFVNSGFTGYMPLAAGNISATTLNSSGNLNVSGTSNLANNLIFSSQANGVNFGGVSSTATPTYSTSGNMITGGSDYAGLSKLNSVAVQTWFGFSVSPTISGQTVAQGSPAFSINARTGEMWNYGSSYLAANTGSVGIGTTTPGSYKLFVNGTAKFTGTVTAGSFSGPLSGTLSSANVSSGEFGGNTGGGNYIFGATVAGNVGIGTTTPAAKLSVASGRAEVNVFNNSGAEILDWPSAGLSIRRIDDYTQMKMLQLGHRDDNTYQTSNTSVWNLSLLDNTGNKTLSDANTDLLIGGPGDLLLTPANNVGIGTTTPTQKLSVAGNANFTGTVTAGSFSGPLSGTLGAANVSNGVFGDNTGGGNYSFMGNVGIGTNSPTNRLTIVGGSVGQTNALISVRTDGSGATGNAIEFGHPNQSGYLSTLGANTNNGRPFLAFNSEAGTTQNTFRTRGIVGRVISADLSGGILFSRVTNSNADNQALTNDVIINSLGSVGIGTTAPAATLDVNGGTRIAGNLTMTGTANITGVQKITVNTIDPLYNIFGTNYASFAASVVGGVKEEVTGKLNLNQKVGQEYQAIINFKNQAKGSDLWVWRNVVDFNKDNVEAIITPYGSFANTYYYISGNSLVFRSDRPVEISYRLIAKRFDWQKWPTKPLNQTEKAGLIIK